jgi:hypothetical protein
MTGLSVQPGLCGICRHVARNDTRRGTVYFRCARAQWDERLVKYPRLPVVACVGFEPVEPPAAQAPTPEPPV